MTAFRLHIFFRILLAIIFGISAWYFAASTPFWLMTGWMSLFFILTIVSLIRFVEKSDRELSNFLLAIRQNDFTNTYPQTRKNRKRLYQAFNVITSEFIRIRSEKESNFHFLKTVVEHSGVPLIAYTVHDETITLINKAAKELFGLPHITRLATLHRVSADLVTMAQHLRSGDKVLLKTEINGESIYLSVVARELVLQERTNKVIAFHNINSELDQKELESWQKLIRVLTHEIKNSVIPISTLAEVINEMLQSGESGHSLAGLSPEDQEDLVISMKTIEKRSKGLVKFVTSYGDLAKVPRPELSETDMVELVQSTGRLEEKVLKQAGIKLDLILPETGILLRIDRGMIEQVMINLIKNAIEALREANTPDPMLSIELKRDQGGVLVLFRDNGPGMEAETMDNIFVPFFTTKIEGSGIGLSYSKQIMRAHKGNIRAWSEPDKGATFELRF